MSHPWCGFCDTQHMPPASGRPDDRTACDLRYVSTVPPEAAICPWCGETHEVPPPACARKDALTERRPTGNGWVKAKKQPTPANASVLALSAWVRGKVVVISSLQVARLGDPGETPLSGVYPEGLWWHLEVWRKGKPPTGEHLRPVFRAFAPLKEYVVIETGAAGLSRHFWLKATA